LDCREYISKYVSAQADGELSSRELQAADEHLAKCASCRALLTEERSLKGLIRTNAGIVRTPADVRLRIRAALGDVAEPRAIREAVYPAQSVTTRRGATAGRDGVAVQRHEAGRSVAQSSRRWLWGSLGGVVAMLIVALAVLAGHGSNPGDLGITQPVPAFDLAISKYLAVERNFSPNVPPEAYSNTDGTVYAWVQNGDPAQNADPVRRIATTTPEASTASSDTSDDVARAYREMSMPDDLLDLSQAGYHLAGARAERLPDGRPITYTLYDSESGSILSICYPDAAMAAPVGAINWLGMRSFYRYKGYSICMSFYPAGHFVSILVSRMPVTALLNDVAAADSSIAGN
jgi:hypothetical protein